MKKSLIETNPYLKNSATRMKLVARAVRTSSGVEGIKPKNKKTLKFNITRRKNKKIYQSSKV